MGCTSLLATTAASFFEAQVEEDSHRFDSTTHKENEMLVFRKWFLALALVTLTMGLASAQTVSPAFQCVANAGVPPIVRAEGIAELVGDIVLNCTGGYPALFANFGQTNILGAGQIPLINVQIFLNTNITSKLFETSYNSSEALLLIDEPTDVQQRICTVSQQNSGGCQVNVRPWDPMNVYKPYSVTTAGATTTYNPWNMFQGRVTTVSSVAFLGVPIDAPGTSFTRIIRITNIRANANQLGVSSTLVPTQIIAYISATGTTSIPINNPQQTVAWVQQGMTYTTRNIADDSSSAIAYNQCSSSYSSLYATPTYDNYACPGLRLRFSEGFASAFKTRFSAGPVSGDNQNTPGAVYTQSESGFFRSSDNVISGWGTLAGAAGVATQGTRLRVQFNNVPAGLRLFVTLSNVGYTSTNAAVLVNTASDGTGTYVATSKNAAAASTCTWGASYDFAEVPIFSNTGVAVWEVTATNPLAIQGIDFGLIVAYTANTANNLPGIATVTTNGTFAPLSTVVTASAIYPVPRFADTSTAKSTFYTQQCVTNLLFPFVSNQAGFDTGLVISNTTKDPWGHATESGTCEINYYGDTNGGAAPAQQVSAAIPAGDYVSWTLSGGGKYGVTATPGFQGYMIVRCKFRYAHGFAFISDVGAQKLSHGYLALVMNSLAARSDVGTGETLGQ